MQVVVAHRGGREVFPDVIDVAFAAPALGL
jgi:hypothetical protein